MPHTFFYFSAIAALLLTSSAAQASLFDSAPACTVEVVRVDGKTATVRYTGPRGDDPEFHNVSKMPVDQVPKAALMLGCELRS